ncbi:MAG: hypothetical protein KDC84_13100 [Crocinitomicaceae bacterium]|nr:hypothetical protein [Crocinitomicaceae bacterium]
MLAILLNIFLISCAVNLDGGKIEELNEEQVQKEYCKKKGIDFEKNKRYICVNVSSTFKHVAAVGSFASDRGCMGESYYFAGDFISLKELTPRALEYYGWKEASKREDLALKWVTKVVTVWESEVNSMPEGFSESSFFKPTVWTENNQVKVKLWIQEPAGMLNQSDYYAAEYTFSESGEIVDVKKLGSKTIQH